MFFVFILLLFLIDVFVILVLCERLIRRYCGIVVGIVNFWK